MEQIANPAGLRVLESLIQLVENKGEIKKVIEEINKARDEANAKIAVVGKIREIEALRSKVDADLQAAESTLASAKSEAETILKKAGVKATSERAKQRQAAEILAQQQARDEALAAREQNVAAREQELQKLMDQTSALQKETTELKADAEELAKKASAQLAVFERAVAQAH